jgi:5-methylcytosine-specific restriction endonuclease McrA
MPDLSRQTAYEWYLGSEFWAQKRQAALERANYICQRCFKEPATEVHHLTYVRLFNELAADLQPVCSRCHRRIHERKPANDNQLSLPDR